MLGAAKLPASIQTHFLIRAWLFIAAANLKRNVCRCRKETARDFAKMVTALPGCRLS